MSDELEPVQIDFARRNANKVRRRSSPSAIGASEVVSTSRRGNLVPAVGDTVCRRDGRLQTGAAGLLEVERRSIGRQRAAQDALAHQVEVPAVF